MYIADALSRASQEDKEISFSEQEKFIHLVRTTPDRLQEIRDLTSGNTVLQKVELEVRPYWPFREDLIWYDGIIYKAQRILIPLELRKEMLGHVHYNLLGTCQQDHGNRYIDLFEFQACIYILLIDAYSRCLEVRLLKDFTGKTVVDNIMSIFAANGIPDIVYTDQGLHLVNKGFKKFATDWSFSYITNIPTYSQSDGLVEREACTNNKISVLEISSAWGRHLLSTTRIQEHPK
ncbi:hypothetical protein PR048_023578 [Dryococelus australis]|uniref:Integrase catalytic domain-containing protein n=1 Tax=Dryococelus australis TaxID=614101 RepID=A0ABQ9GUF5_9NEOP|nr:hypothetical protein PR048_023578 [Dryococelus australis]